MHRDTYVMAFLQTLMNRHIAVKSYAGGKLCVEYFETHATKMSTYKANALQRRLNRVWDDTSRFICAKSTGSCKDRIPLRSHDYHELLLKEGITGTQKQYDMDIYAAGKVCFIVQGHPFIEKEDMETIVQEFFASRWGNSDCMQEVIASARSFGVYNWDLATITHNDIKGALTAKRIIHPLHETQNSMQIVPEIIHQALVHCTSGL